MQPGFGVFLEVCGQPRVAPGVDVVLRAGVEAVEGFGDRSGRGEVGDWWGVGDPDVAGEVEDWNGHVSRGVEEGV